jgi:hypothetical protein
MAPPSNDRWQAGVQTYDAFYVQSTGRTFTAPLKIRSVSSTPDASGYNNLQEQFIGDYIGIVSGPTTGVRAAGLVGFSWHSRASMTSAKGASGDDRRRGATDQL